MKRITFSLRKTAFFEAAPSAAGGVPAAPDVSFVPAMMRRKLSFLEKAALAVLHEAAAPAGTDCALVFASRYGEWRRTVRLLRQLFDESELSPAGFSLSVHNATAGLFSLLRGGNAPYTSLAAGARTLENALLQAILAQENVLFAYAEEPLPELYAERFPEIVPHAGALALFLEFGNGTENSPENSDGNGARFCATAGVAGTPPLGFSALRKFLEKSPDDAAAQRLETAMFTLTRAN